MARIEEHTELDLDSPVLVEGLPGVGLVGKIAADHLIEIYDMTQYASCHCEGLPRVAVYEKDGRNLTTPVRIYADEQRDLLVLRSDVPVSPESAPTFASCVMGWFEEKDILPICVSGLPTGKEGAIPEKDGVPEMYGVGTGDAGKRLDEHDIDRPNENGMVSGPTGALLAEAYEQEIESIALVVQANAQFPDPEAARVILRDGVAPLASLDIETDALVDRAEEVAEARKQLAKKMQQAAEDESSQAKPLGMYQ